MPDTRSSPFPVTEWTAVVEVCRSGVPEDRQRALAQLCADYWYPLYAFARRQQRSREDAEDLTQGFFRYILEKEIFASADPGIGKLRTFLLTVFQRYIGDARMREQAVKRGGGRQIISLDVDDAERRYADEVADSASPEQTYDRSWAISVLKSAIEALREDEKNAGREQQFEVLECFLIPDAAADSNYERAAASLGMSIEAVRKAVSRLRGKFRDHLRRQIAATLRDPQPAQIDEELSALRAALMD